VPTIQRKIIMSSIHKTKMRLQQLTGSMVPLKPSTVAPGVAVASVADADSDGVGLLKYFAQAISNIHGNTEFGANTVGEFKYGGATGGLRALKPSDDSKIVIGGVAISGAGSVSGLAAGNISDSTVSITATSIGLSGSPSYSLSKDVLVITGGSTGAVLAFRVVSQSSSAIGVVGLPSASTGESLTGSDLSGATIQNGDGTFLAYQNVRTDRVEGRAGLIVDGGTGALDMDASTLDLDITNAGAMTFGGALDLDAASLDADFTGAIDIQAAANSEIGLSDGLFKFDLDGSDVADGLLVDAEGSITLQANHSSDGAIIINAEGSGGVIQLQQGNGVKLAVSSSAVEVYDQTRVKDATEASSITAASLMTAGGLAVQKKFFLGSDMSLAADSKTVTIGSNDPLVITHRSSPGSDKQSRISAPSLHLSGTDAAVPSVLADSGAGLILSGSGMLSFIGGGIGNGGSSNFAFGGVSENGLLLAAGTDAADYITAFSTSTTILGALTSVKNSITSGDNTAFQQVLTGTAGLPEGYELNMATSLIGGSASGVDFKDAGKHQLDVYVNGQLLMSGTEAERSSSAADYTVATPGDALLKFAFDLAFDDVVRVLDRQS